MGITYNLTINERIAIHSHAISLKEYDRELLDMDFRFGLNDFRAKLNSMGLLSEVSLRGQSPLHVRHAVVKYKNPETGENGCQENHDFI